MVRWSCATRLFRHFRLRAFTRHQWHSRAAAIQSVNFCRVSPSGITPPAAQSLWLRQRPTVMCGTEQTTSGLPIYSPRYLCRLVGCRIRPAPLEGGSRTDPVNRSDWHCANCHGVVAPPRTCGSPRNVSPSTPIPGDCSRRSRKCRTSTERWHRRLFRDGSGHWRYSRSFTVSMVCGAQQVKRRATNVQYAGQVSLA